MMQTAQIGLVGESNPEREKKIDAQQTINMMIWPSPEGKSKAALVTQPGIKLKKTLDALGPIRPKSLFEFKEKLYCVAHDKVFIIDSDFVAQEIGTIGTTSGPVFVEANQNNQVIFVDGSNGYLFESDISSFHEITDAAFLTDPAGVVFLDGYFIVFQKNSRSFQVSTLNNGNIWNSNINYLETKPDIIVGMAVLNRRLYLFGKQVTEVWYDAGLAGFPLKRDNNSILEYGCIAPLSIAVGYGKIFWLSGNQYGYGSVMMTSGTTPQPASKQAIDYQIQSYSDITDCEAIIYRIDGHVIYQASFPTGNHTWIYDATVIKWFEAEAPGGGRKIANSHAFFNGKHYIGSYKDQKIYELSNSYYTDDDQVARRVRITNHVSDTDYRFIRITKLTIDAQTGDGIPNSEYADAMIFMSFSRDGGVTYCNNVSLPLGKIGERIKRIIWRRIGSSRMLDVVFKFEIYCKQKIVLLGAEIEYEVVRG